MTKSKFDKLEIESFCENIGGSELEFRFRKFQTVYNPSKNFENLDGFWTGRKSHEKSGSFVWNVDESSIAKPGTNHLCPG